eukprot:Rhum_TRINITY_DN1253_c0_g1::Rhum_TRINITY_DN1253_c0_g1_i1::g.3741::m.3741
MPPVPASVLRKVEAERERMERVGVRDSQRTFAQDATASDSARTLAAWDRLTAKAGATTRVSSDTAQQPPSPSPQQMQQPVRPSDAGAEYAERIAAMEIRDKRYNAVMLASAKTDEEAFRRTRTALAEATAGLRAAETDLRAEEASGQLLRESLDSYPTGTCAH